jgi:hypothetical protein
MFYLGVGEVFEEVFGDEGEAVEVRVVEARVSGEFADLHRSSLTSLVLKVFLVNSSTLKAYST